MNLHMTFTYLRCRRTLLRNSIWSSGLIRPRNVITCPSHKYVLAIWRQPQHVCRIESRRTSTPCTHCQKRDEYSILKGTKYRTQLAFPRSYLADATNLPNVSTATSRVRSAHVAGGEFVYGHGQPMGNGFSLSLGRQRGGSNA